MTPTKPSILDRTRELVTPALRAALGRLDPWCHYVATYHFGFSDVDGHPVAAPGGKAIRPALVLLAAEAAGAPAAVAVPGAVAVELVHNFSLIHDDLLDGDHERRHRRTVWSQWGPPSAILAGDALLGLAQEVLLAAAPPSAALAAASTLAAATRELIQGQVEDLSFERRHDVALTDCLAMARAKTGALLGASTGIGATLADAAPATVAALTSFGRDIGLAFQFVDDVLGIWGDPAVTGKPVHSDLRARKKSLPLTHAAAIDGLDPRLARWLTRPDDDTPLPVVATLLDQAGVRAWSLDQAASYVRQAEHTLTVADLKPEPRAELLALAHYIVARDA